MKRHISLLAVVLLILSGCMRQDKQEAPSRMITVSILPQKYFVNRIAGDLYQVNVMIPPGANPVTYDPTPGQMQKVEQSVAYIRIGHIIFEKAWMDKIKGIHPGLKIFDQSKGIDLIHGHSHDHDHHNHHHAVEGVDPHIWTSPKAVKTQVKHIRDFLIGLDSTHRTTYENNTSRLLREIDSLHGEISARLKPLEGGEFLIFHPALSYFARDYHLKQIALEQGGKEPNPSRLKEIIDHSEAANIRAVFVQKQFSIDEARALARELDVKVVQIDPLAYDWISNMDSMSRTIARAISNKQDKK